MDRPFRASVMVRWIMPTDERVFEYHEVSKHGPRGHAPGPGFLDWATQPEPFRAFHGAARIDLPLAGNELTVPFSSIRGKQAVQPEALSLRTLSILLERSVGLAAWKEFGGSAGPFAAIRRAVTFIQPRSTW